MAVLEIKNLSVYYDKKQILENISLSIPQQKITAIIGPSGCGKSTLLQCLNGMIHDIDSASMKGNVYLNGQDFNHIPKEELRRRIGLVFQVPTPFPFSIYKNMAYAPKYYGIRDKHNLDEIITDKLQLCGLYDEVKHDLKHHASKLSGGQQQRLCIARALTVNPEILLLDEPCSALDVQNTAIIEQLLIKLKETYTIILVTHNISQAKRVADEVIYLDDHRIIEHGEAAQIFEQPRFEETKAFLKGAF